MFFYHIYISKESVYIESWKCNLPVFLFDQPRTITSQQTDMGDHGGSYTSIYGKTKIKLEVCFFFIFSASSANAPLPLLGPTYHHANGMFHTSIELIHRYLLTLLILHRDIFMIVIMDLDYKLFYKF